MTPNRKRALIVEDEFIIAEGLRAQLVSLGVEVCGIASSADEAIALAVALDPNFVLMDVRLRGEKDGVDAAMAIHERIKSHIIFVTGSREQETINRIQMDHAIATLFKPISSVQLKRIIEQIPD